MEDSNGGYIAKEEVLPALDLPSKPPAMFSSGMPRVFFPVGLQCDLRGGLDLTLEAHRLLNIASVVEM